MNIKYMKNRRFAPSKQIAVRFHSHEIKTIDTGVKKLKIKMKDETLTRSDFIRHKTLD